ncbi:MAG: NADH-quinone oxidoreductase subunit NuoH [Elusimicrobia bacterium]|nr:NADH-quinone oxidoreductase subunit NuoH [Candidatus Obscuribacterium magneticum]
MREPLSYLDALKAKEGRMKQSGRRAALWVVLMGAAGLLLVTVIGELQPYIGRIDQFLQAVMAAKKWPSWIPFVVTLVVPALLVMGVMMALPLFLVWWERKVAAHMQVRLGPMKVGGWHGWAQTIADTIKLFLKEIVEPEGADKWVYRLAPAVAFLPGYLAFAPLPFGMGLTALHLDISLLFVIAVSSLSTIGILMAGWGSGNKYSLLGGLRGAAQIVSYEIPRALSIVPVVMWAGTLSLTGIWKMQVEPLWGWFPRWFIFYPVVGQISFLIYLITTVAETNRIPFDVPEAESELVSGFHTEYGGLKFAFFFLAEYTYVFVGSLVGAVLFLGGGSPVLPQLSFIPSWAWFLGKTFGLVFIFLWARWTLPRLRVDRIMDLCWKVFIPWTLFNIFLTGFIILWRAR